VGREAGNALQLDDPAVWGQHLTLSFKRHEGYFVTKDGDAVIAVNNQAFETVRLFNGDIITVGSTKLQFWLASVQQHGLRLRELLVWTVLIAVSAFQLLLIYQLLR
jgi:pSer/pThr/pTyr-binding forkhead associated (FHA) protein